ncbi:MAG: hypothetical protein ACE361_20320 [Aureliella sp.]
MQRSSSALASRSQLPKRHGLWRTPLRIGVSGAGIALLVFMFILATAPSAFAQASDPIGPNPNTADDKPVVRFYVPDKDLRRLLDRQQEQFTFIERSELKEKLLTWKASQQVTRPNEISLKEAFYFGRCDLENIRSEQSVWRFGTESEAKESTYFSPFFVGKTSLPLRSARQRTSVDRQLVDSQLIASNGDLYLSLNESLDLWFGFTSIPKRQDWSSTFQFRVPVASKGILLLSVPSNLELNSPDVVTTQIETASDAFPDGLYSGKTLDLSPNSKWWLIDISGKSTFELSVTERNMLGANEQLHFISSCENLVHVDEHGISSTTTFELPVKRLRAPLLLSVPRGTRVTSVVLNENPIEWNTTASMSGDSNLITISPLADRSPSSQPTTPRSNSTTPTPSLIPSSPTQNETSETAASRTILKLESFAPITTSLKASNFTLVPTTVANSFTLSGETTITTGPNLQILEIVAPGATVNLPADNTSNQEAIEYLPSAIDDISSLPSWSMQWSRQPQACQMLVAQTSKRIEALSLTTISPTSAKDTETGRLLNVAAQCRLRVSAENLRANQIAVRLNKGWFIDQVELGPTGSSEPSIELSRRPAASDEQNASYFVTWKSPKNAISFELQILAHRTTSLSNRTKRIATVTGSEQTDWYQVSDSRGLDLTFENDTLNYVITKTDKVPAWVKTQTGEDSDLLLRGDGRNLPPLGFDSSYAQYSIEGYLKFESSSVARAKALFDIQSPNQPLKKVSVTVPASWRNSRQLKWTLNDRKLDPTLISEIQNEDPSELLFEIQFREPITEQGLLLLDGLEHQGHAVAAQSLAIPTFRFADGDLSEIVAIAPQSCLINTSQPNSTGSQIELIPAVSCCNDAIASRLSLSSPEQRDDESTQLVAVRFEPNGGSTPMLNFSNVAAGQPLAWIDSVRETHRFSGNQSMQHSFVFDLRGLPNAAYEIGFPADFTTIQFEIDGVEQLSGVAVDDRNGPNISGRLSSSGMIRIRLLFESLSSNSFWFRSEDISSFVTSMQIVDSSCEILVAPGWLAMPSSKREEAAPKDPTDRIDSLRPQKWWSHFSLASGTQEPLPDGWTRYVSLAAPKSSDQQTWYFVRNSGLAAISMVAVGIGSLIAFSLFMRLPRLGWCLLCGCVLGLLFVPERYLFTVQLFALSLAIGFSSRVVAFLAQETRRESNEHSGISPSSSRLLGFLRIVFPFVLSIPLLSADSAEAQVRSTDSIGAFPGGSIISEYYPIFIPETADGEVDGSYVYIPESFLEVLDGVNNQRQEVDAQSWIEAASYSVRFFPDSAELLSPPELVAEFRVRIGSGSPMIRLPFDSSELELLAGEINDQPGGLESGSLKQEPAQVTFTPMISGTYNLRLYFAPMKDQRIGGFRTLQASIPPIASSVLRISADDSLDVRVRLGDEITQLEKRTNSRSSPAGESEELPIGPSEFIDLRWRQRTPLSTSESTPETRHRVWVNSTNDDVTVGMAISVANPRTLPDEFRLVLNDSWQIVGTDLADATVIAFERPPLSNRRVYTLRWRTDAMDSEGAVIRAQLARVSSRGTTEGDLRTLPFPYLQEAGIDDERILIWTSGTNSPWELSIGSTWVPISVADDTQVGIWGDYLQSTRLAKIFELPSSGTRLQVTRNPTSDQTPIADATLEYQVGHQVTSQKTVLRFQTPKRASNGALKINLPKEWKVDDCLTDGTPARFTTHVVDGLAQLFLYPSPAQLEQGISELQLSLSSPTAFETRQKLETILISSVALSFTEVVFEAAPSIELELLSSDVDLSAAITDSDDAPIRVGRRRWALSGTLPLATLPGETRSEDLEASPQSTATEFRLFQVPIKSSSILSTMTIDRTADGSWGATWFTQLQAGTSLESIHLQIPNDAFAEMTCSTRFERINQPNDSTSVVAVELEKTDTRSVVLQWPLDSNGGTQTIRIPEIKVVTANHGTPLLKLPRKIDGKPITWHTSLAPTEIASEHSLTNEEHLTVRGPEKNTGISWTNAVGDRQAAMIRRQEWQVLSLNNESATGIVDFWLDPRGNAQLNLAVPDELSIIAITAGQETLSYSKSAAGLLSILLSPNRAPLIVRAHWSYKFAEPNPDRREFELPLISQPRQGDIASESSERFILLSDTDYQVADSAGVVGDLGRAIAWWEQVNASLSTVEQLSEAEKWIWTQSWDPTQMRIGRQTQLTSADDLRTDLETVEERWQTVLERLSLPPISPPDRQSRFVESGDSGFQWNKLSEPKVTLIPSAKPSQNPAEIVYAISLAAIMLLGLLLHRIYKTQVVRLLATYPALFWVLLALLSWLLLPVQWPSWILLATAFLLAAGQWTDHRRAAPYR